jgi:hypothetical protein
VRGTWTADLSGAVKTVEFDERSEVTDETLKELAPFAELEELVLNDVQITDDGLKYLPTFPHLKVLSLRGTQVTDKGLKELAR